MVFFAICGIDMFHRRLFSVGADPTPEEHEAEVRRAVRTFLHAFGPR